MIEAIHTGLLYGLIAGASVVGFVLTMGLVYGVLELYDFLDSFIFGGDSNGERKRSRGD